MDLTTLRYAFGAWSRPFPELDSPETVVLAFGAPGFRERPAVLRDLMRAFPTSAVIGCSTAGEIDQTRIRDESIAVAVARFARTRVRRAAARLASPAQSFDAGARIADDLRGPELRAVIVLSEGIHVDGAALARGLAAHLPEGAVVAGGLAGDGQRYAESWVLTDDGPAAHAVVAVGLYGDGVVVGHGCNGGWDAVDRERVVTRADGRVLYELDGAPALAACRGHLGPGAAVVLRGAAWPAIARTIVAIDDESEAVVLSGEVPPGARAQLVRPQLDRLILGAQAAGAAANRPCQGPLLALAIGGAARRIALGDRSEEEIEATLDTLPRETQQVGFYSYGELSPLPSGRCDLRDHTMTVTLVGEAP